MDPEAGSSRDSRSFGGSQDSGRVVSEILQCSLETALELLAGCGNDVNSVIDKFCTVTEEETGETEVEGAAAALHNLAGEENVEELDVVKYGNEGFEQVEGMVGSILNNNNEDGFKKVRVMPSRSFDEDSEEEREYRIAEGHFLRMVGKRKKFEIKSIDIVHNFKLKEKFELKKKELRKRGLDDKPLLIFHGTPQENIDPILKNNFDLNKVVNGRAFGNGVYFSECPDVSMGYSVDQSSLILCLVLQGGNSREVPGAKVRDHDNDSPNNAAWAIVVPDVDQILPKYVINFTEKSNQRSPGIPLHPLLHGHHHSSNHWTRPMCPACPSYPTYPTCQLTRWVHGPTNGPNQTQLHGTSHIDSEQVLPELLIQELNWGMVAGQLVELQPGTEPGLGCLLVLMGQKI
eukprot:GFUD01045556.1.p1 GENE.GFUD01045556.1~~GFUD01045556.1.p1  ORF type:complete len:403 (+),score=116.93 GFUD01045556.1:47-1255(+)